MHPLHNKAVLFGALLPDLTLFIMWAVAKLSGVPERLIWSEWYYSATWQQAGAMTNSIPAYLAIVLFAVIMAKGWRNLVPNRSEHLSDSLVNRQALLQALAAFALAAFIHVLADLPLHHDDGHPHFWPISHWVFASPVSYWDPQHYGHIWSVIEIVLSVALVLILWRRFQSVWVRFLLILSLSAYGGIAVYWYSNLT